MMKLKRNASLFLSVILILFWTTFLSGCRSQSQAENMGVGAVKTMAESMGNAASSIAKSAANAAGRSMRR
jgi:hypothetical protein